MSASSFPLTPEQLLGPALVAVAEDFRKGLQYLVLHSESYTAQLADKVNLGGEPRSSYAEVRLWLSAFETLEKLTLGPQDISSPYSENFLAIPRSVYLPPLKEADLKVTRTNAPTRLMFSFQNNAGDVFSICIEEQIGDFDVPMSEASASRDFQVDDGCRKIILTFYWSDFLLSWKTKSCHTANKIGFLTEDAKETTLMRIETPESSCIKYLFLHKESSLPLAHNSINCGMVRVTANLADCINEDDEDDAIMEEAMLRAFEEDDKLAEYSSSTDSPHSDSSSSSDESTSTINEFDRIVFSPEASQGQTPGFDVLQAMVDWTDDDEDPPVAPQVVPPNWEEEDVDDWILANEKVRLFGKTAKELKQELKERYQVTGNLTRPQLIERLATLGMMRTNQSEP